MNALVNALETSIFEAHSLVSRVGNFSKNTLTTQDVNSFVYHNYHQELWGATMTSILGQKCLELFHEVHVLHVGSGKHKTFYNLFNGTDESVGSIVYHSIDREESPKVSIRMQRKDNVFYEEDYEPDSLQTLIRLNKYIGVDLLVQPQIVKHTHHVFDAFDYIHTDTHDMPFDSFHMIIIDIEPHGREWEIFSNYERYMCEQYIVIFKCIGCMDIIGCKFARQVLKKIHADGKLVDVFAIRSFPTLNRDVIAICSRHPVENPQHHVYTRILTSTTAHDTSFPDPIVLSSASLRL
jgi:hypothetical protein